jgi:hypothetical protein
MQVGTHKNIATVPVPFGTVAVLIGILVVSTGTGIMYLPAVHNILL